VDVRWRLQKIDIYKLRFVDERSKKLKSYETSTY